jgi:hypothetical protein
VFILILRIEGGRPPDYESWNIAVFLPQQALGVELLLLWNGESPKNRNCHEKP